MDDIRPEENAAAKPDEPTGGGFKFCTRCGRRLAADAAYCDGCGHAVNAQKQAPDIAFAPQKKVYPPEKLSDIVGKKREYYNRRFAELNETGSHVSWNWYACLGWLWYAYRKMPLEAAAFFVLYVVLGAVEPFGWLLRLGLLAFSGAMGNYIYLKHIERVIDRIDALPASMRSAAVKESGGVSGLMLLVAFIVSIASGGLGFAGSLLKFTRPNIGRGIRYFFRL